MIESYRNIYSKLEDIPTKYITAKQLSNLKSLGINTVYDLVYYFPRTYDDRTNIKKIGELKFNEYVVIKASVMSVVNLTVRSGKKIVKAMVSDGTGIMEILWFGMPYIKKSLKIGEEYLFIGQTKKSTVFQLINPEYKLFSGQQKVSESEILPIYSSNKNITQNSLRKLVEKFLVNFLNYFEENIPKELVKEYKIMERKSAIKNIHYPVSMKEIEEAKRRFAIEELLILELGILKNRFIIENSNSKNYEVEGKKEKVREFLSQLTFNLTNAQKKVIKEIYDEISNGKIVNRLIQGDVGSGKTVVATIAMVATALTGKQACLMVPTELLADQHYETICALTKETEIKVGKLTGTTTLKERRQLLEQLEKGELQLLVGTHALFQEDVIYHDLAFVVIDEQHRFGVKQRAQLAQKGTGVNVLQMTATPIPRTLAITTFGEMDTSILKEAPKGRQPIQTFWVKEQELEKVYDYIEKQVQAGRQAYVISPLIEESENLDVQNATEIYEMISKRFENRLSVGLLHGRLKSDEKESVMTAFQKNDVQVLVSTTVIEVGVDVPNATVMVILDADRFGLAQLHQLRGRVGRGEHASTCILIASPKTEQGKQRMQIMCESTDGFYLSQKDLEIRGSGDVFGLRQSGIPEFKVADIVQDYDILEQAREDAIIFVIEEEDSVAYKEIQEFIEQTSRETEEIVNG